MKTRTTHRSCRGRVARGHFRGIGRPAGKWENGRAAGEHEDGAAVERHAHPDERATEKGLGRPLHRQAESKNAIGIQRDRRRCSPSTIVTAPVTARAAGDVPALKPYKFAMVQEKLVIVNPSDGKIVDVITRLSFGVMAGHGVSRTASLSPLSPAIPLRSTPPR
jgi:hypothetical protein